MEYKQTKRGWWPLVLAVIFLIWLANQNIDDLIPCRWYMPDPAKNCAGNAPIIRN